MKKFFLVLSLLFVLTIVKGQSPMFYKGDKLVNLGIGIRSYPVVYASADYCIVDDIADKGSIGFGPYLGLGFSTSDLHISAGARGTFHYPVIDDLDTYVGIGLGAKIWGSLSSGFSSSYVPAFFLGANYPISDNINVFGELGSAVSYLTVGVTLTI